MRVRTQTLLLATATLACFVCVQACDSDQMQSGCKLYGGHCTCGYGCKSEYMYRTRRDCLNVLRGVRERSSNVCYRQPCRSKGICIQTTKEPGFICKCEGTGYYGSNCEIACPTMGTRGLPHECVVI